MILLFVAGLMNLIVFVVRSLTNDGRPKSASVSENIDALREMAMQDRHVIFD